MISCPTCSVRLTLTGNSGTNKQGFADLANEGSGLDEEKMYSIHRHFISLESFA